MITRIPLFLIAAFSPSGQVFRAFDHLIAAGAGEILFAPMVIADGDLRGVIDHCPVPWEEAWAVLDTPLEEAVSLNDEAMARDWRRLSRLAPTGWSIDAIDIGNSAGPTKAIERVTHVCGLRYARVKAWRGA